MNLFTAARKICEAFNYDPGHSDLDDEQPIHISVTLGDWRRLRSALMLAGQSATPPEGVTIITRECEMCRGHLLVSPRIYDTPEPQKENG